jgi:hypothetical protein
VKTEFIKRKCECCGKEIECMTTKKYCYNCGKYTAHLKQQVTYYKKHYLRLNKLKYGDEDGSKRKRE